MGRPRREFADFSGGLVDGLDPSQIPENAASDISNIDISDLTLQKKRGSIRVNHTAQPQPGLFFDTERDGWGVVEHETAQLPTDSFTVEFWTNPSNLTTKDTVLYKGSNGIGAAVGAVNLATTDVFAVYFENNGATNEVAFEYVVQGTPNVVVKWRTTAQNFSAGTDVHIAWHRDHTVPTARCIVNGSSVTVTNVAGTDNGADIVQGTMVMTVGAATENTLGRVNASDTSNHRLFRGRLDEIRIWDDLRSAAEIDAHKDRELVAADVSSDLLSYWKCNNGSLYSVTMDDLATATEEIRLEPRRPQWTDGLFNSAPGFRSVQLDGYQDFIEIDIGQSTLTGATIARESTGTKKPQARLYDLLFSLSRDTNEQAIAVGQYSWASATAVAGVRWTVEIAFQFDTLSASTDNWILFWDAKRGDPTHDAILKVFVDSTGDLRVQVSATDATNANPETYDIPDADWNGGARPVVTVDTPFMVSVTRTELDVFAYIHNLTSTQAEGSTTAGGTLGAFTAGANWGPGTDSTWDDTSVEGIANNILIGTNSVDTSDTSSLYSEMKVQELRVWASARGSNKNANTFNGIWQYNHEPLNRQEHVERTFNLNIVTGTGPTTYDTVAVNSPLIGYWPMTDDWRDYNVNHRQAVQDLGRANVPIPNSGAATTEDSISCAGAPGVLLNQSHTPVFGRGMVIGQDQRPTVDGIFNFIQTDGTQELLIVAGCQARRLNTSGGIPGSTTQVVDSGIMTGRLISFAKFSNVVYAGNGLNNNLRFDEDRSVVDLMGIIPPEIQPQLLPRHTGSGTEEAGDVQYIYSYFSSSTGIESAPSPFSAVARPDADTRVLVRMARPRQQRLSGDKANHVDRIRIYRTFHGETSGNAEVPGSGTFHFVKELGLPAAASHYLEWDDDTPDTRLGLAFPTSQFNGQFLRGFPPPFRYIATHNGRVFGAGDADHRNRLYFSEALLPDSFPPLNFIDLEGSIGQTITGLVTLVGNLYIFTPSSTWVLSGFDEVNFRLQLLDEQVGCVSHHSIVVIDNLVYFASRRGPYRFDGSRFQFLGESISGRSQSTWELLDSSNYENMTGAFLQRQGLYLLGVSRTSRTV